MKKLRYLLLAELAVMLASIAVGYATGWRMPVPPRVAIPAGLVLWGGGIAYTMHLRRQVKEAGEKRRRPQRHRGYPMVEARAAMHLGVALGTRSWPTLVTAAVFAAVNLGLAVHLRRRLRGRFPGSGR